MTGPAVPAAGGGGRALFRLALLLAVVAPVVTVRCCWPVPGQVRSTRAAASPPAGLPLEAPATGTRPAEPAPRPGPTPPPGSAEVLDLGFADLGSFDCSKEDYRIPGKVLAWNGRRVRVRGFMIPVDSDGDQVKAFLLLPVIPTCCFGCSVRQNEIVKVDVAAQGGCAYRKLQVSVLGTLGVKQAGPDDFIYTLTGDSILSSE